MVGSAGHGDTSAGAQVVTASILVIGDEILSGRTADVNVAHIARRLDDCGIRLREVRIVPDAQDRIVGALGALRGAYDYVFTTGGIGPTHDDITADAVAACFNVAIFVDPRAVDELRKRYSEDELTPARMRMARIPNGAALIENEVSAAPGFMIGNVIVMAGVPRIMQAMLERVLPRLRHGARMLSLSLTVPRPEGEVASPLAETQSRCPDVAIGSYPFVEADGRLAVNIVLRGPDAQRLQRVADALAGSLGELGIAVESCSQS
jgi:molybdenum cofactor synthesis domain-containing protein